ncbi:MAG: NUDIX hydrolase [Anaerolineaceae bacterium]|nr:NUDIX hydrolase [Anaerolineaceae bacterium]
MTETKIINRKEVFKGRAFNVEELQLALPDGREQTYYLVDHLDAVTILPIDREGMVYFVSQFRVGAEKNVLELPAGVMDPGEEPLTSAHRELQEEIGHDAGKMKKIGSFWMAPGYTTEFMHVFLATDLIEHKLPEDDDEFLRVVKVDLGQAFEMIKSGEIKDGKTLSTFMLALPSLKELGLISD